MGPSMFVDGDPELADPRAIDGHASMGPSMFVDGDPSGVRVAMLSLTASMGPSMFVDGDSRTAHARASRPAAASMGPSMFVDGDTMSQIAPMWAQLLQWGRRCSSTETTATSFSPQRLISLQWGRRCSSTETFSQCFWGCFVVCFNGAVDVRRRRQSAGGR